MFSANTGSVLLAPSPAEKQYDLMYYLKAAAAGGICCSITHGALTPVDVVKTRVQLDPVKVSNIKIGETLKSLLRIDCNRMSIDYLLLTNITLPFDSRI